MPSSLFAPPTQQRMPPTGMPPMMPPTQMMPQIPGNMMMPPMGMAGMTPPPFGQPFPPNRNFIA